MTEHAARAGTLGALGTMVTATATWWLLASAVATWPGPGPVRVDSALVFLVTGAAGLVAGWATLLLACASVSVLAAATTRRSLAPDLVPDTAGHGLTGRVAGGLLVLASLGAAAPAGATATPTTASSTTTATAAAAPAVSAHHAVDTDQTGDAAAAQLGTDGTPAVPDEPPVPGWTPTCGAAQTSGRPAGEVGLVSTAAAAQAEDEVVVHRGDTLWDIAARHLGEHATDQDVAEAWPRWYAANRDVIGENPDLIHPGQRLVVPAHGGVR